MKALRKNPHIYEINLMTWLRELGEKQGPEVGLAGIPGGTWRGLKDLGMDIVWLMGVWQRSPYSRARARAETGLVEAGRALLADFEPADIGGSPYAVRDYAPDPAFGTPEELAALKGRLEEEGLLLVLDFVPNHTACDHPWIFSHPERYVLRPGSGTEACPEGFFPVDGDDGRLCLAHGKDPYFPPWTDTAQINYARPETREAVAKEILRLTALCHGLRCDMAMLPLREVFQWTWPEDLAGAWEEGDFWPLVLERLHAAAGPALLMAEAYWGKERDLLELGVHYAYDKALCDLLLRGDVQGLRQHLSAPVPLQERLVRFLENHDEPRALAAFGPDRIRCAMVVHATLPGMRFWQHGQLEGRCVRVPVQLRRAPFEPPKEGLKDFSARLLAEVNHPVFHEGAWETCRTLGWPDNDSHRNLLVWCWRAREVRRLVVANVSSAPAQGMVRLPPDWLPGGEQVLLIDPLKTERYVRSTAEMEHSGLYAGLGPGDFHFFRLERG